MGNCLVLLQHDKIVRIMKTDGKILEYKTPLKVHQVLSEFSHHAITDKLPAVEHLHPNADMIEGRLYYLLPLPVVPPPPIKKKPKKSVRFSDAVAKEAGEAAGAVRIKIVISKQELQALLRDGDVPQLQKEQITNFKLHNFESNSNTSTKEGFSILESIPEVS